MNDLGDIYLSDFGCPLPSQAVFRWAAAQDWDRKASDEEEVFIQKAVLKRQREFRAGRNTARCCFDILEVGGSPKLQADSVGVGESREPLWPDSVVGSITHTQFECHDSHSAQEYCGVVVSATRDIRSIGIDIERVEHLSPDSLDLVVTPSEWRRAKENCWPTYWPKYLFAAKESFYKCFYPLTGVYLDFLEAEFHLTAIQSMPGVYQVEVVSVSSDHSLFAEDTLKRAKGFVSGDKSLIRAAFWLGA